jgi:3-phenylpropionate/trans-cinnamate dioxygenase ferredoxin subunit
LSSPEVVVPLSEIPVGRMRALRVGEREILVCRTREGVFALDNVCTHAEARMSEGSLRGTRLTCPLHGASFSAIDGSVLGGPATSPLRTYAVRVVGEQALIACASPSA